MHFTPMVFQWQTMAAICEHAKLTKNVIGFLKPT